jgi:inner membrane protein
MLWKTHVVIGAITGALASGGREEMFIAAGLSAAGALIPDIDTPYSKLGSKTIVSKGINSIFGHRGFMHSLMGCVITLFILKGAVSERILYYIGLGYLSHIFSDMLNPMGVPLFWPLQIRFRIPVIKTGNTVERYILFPLLSILLGKVFLSTLWDMCKLYIN